MSTPWPTNDDADYVTHPGIKLVNSNRYSATIEHPIKKVMVCVGIYETEKEALEAYNRKKVEYESLSEQDSIAAASLHREIIDFEKHPGPGVKRATKGKWRAMVSRGTDKVYLGLYATAKEAAEAYCLSKLELKSQNTNRSSGLSSGTADVVNEAHKNKRCKSDLMVQSDGVAEGKSDLICVSDGSLVPADNGDGSSVIGVNKVVETGDSKIDVIAETETTRDLDLEIVDSNGELVGEYSRMDDELWFC